MCLILSGCYIETTEIKEADQWLISETKKAKLKETIVTNYTP